MFTWICLQSTVFHSVYYIWWGEYFFSFCSLWRFLLSDDIVNKCFYLECTFSINICGKTQIRIALFDIVTIQLLLVLICFVTCILFSSVVFFLCDSWTCQSSAVSWEPLQGTLPPPPFQPGHHWTYVQKLTFGILELISKTQSKNSQHSFSFLFLAQSHTFLQCCFFIHSF